MDMMNTARGIIAALLNSPAKRVANIVGIDDKWVDGMYVGLNNEINEKKFNSVPQNQRMILLPQCLRGNNCKATQDDEGYRCRKCGGCKIPEIMKTANRAGSKVFILPGGSTLQRLVKKYKPKSVLGVACNKELVMGISAMDKLKIPVQGILLLRDGCKNTEVDFALLKERIEN